MTTEQGHSALRPYPAWTRDGARPWHHRTHDRALADGRTVRVWLGSHNEWRSHARLHMRGDSDYSRDLTAELLAVVTPISYWEASRGEDVRRWHPEPCQMVGWVGVAYLPRDPRPATAAWPGWQHLDHATRHWTELLSVWEGVVALSDRELVATVEGWVTSR